MTVPRYGFGSSGIFPARAATIISISLGGVSYCPAPVGILNVIIASVCAILPESGALRKHPHSPPRFRLWGHFSIHKPRIIVHTGKALAIKCGLSCLGFRLLSGLYLRGRDLLRRFESALAKKDSAHFSIHKPMRMG